MALLGRARACQAGRGAAAACACTLALASAGLRAAPLALMLRALCSLASPAFARADLSNTLRADERVAVEKIRELSAEARREAAVLEEEALEAARLIRRFEMEARMGPWVK